MHPSVVCSAIWLFGITLMASIMSVGHVSSAMRDTRVWELSAAEWDAPISPSLGHVGPLLQNAGQTEQPYGRWTASMIQRLPKS